VHPHGLPSDWHSLLLAGFQGTMHASISISASPTLLWLAVG
jgi:hypothetical protein